MSHFRQVSRCKKCGKIYGHGIPRFCEKCGAELGEELPLISCPASYWGLMMNETAEGRLKLIDNCEKVVARRKLFRWEVKGREWIGCGI